MSSRYLVSPYNSVLKWRYFLWKNGSISFHFPKMKYTNFIFDNLISFRIYLWLTLFEPYVVHSSLCYTLVYISFFINFSECFNTARSSYYLWLRNVYWYWLTVILLILLLLELFSPEIRFYDILQATQNFFGPGNSRISSGPCISYLDFLINPDRSLFQQ